MPLTIRPVTADDLPDIARIHVAVWQQTYAGQMPQDFLDGLSVEARLKGWQEGHDKFKDDKRYGTLLATTGGQGAGFLSYGPSRDADRADWPEIYAVNILREHQAGGMGYGLYRAARELFSGRTYLWVLSTNDNAVRAYRRWGGVPEPGRTKEILIGGAALRESSVLFE